MGMLLLLLLSLVTQNLSVLQHWYYHRESFKHLEHHDTKSQFLKMWVVPGFYKLNHKLVEFTNLSKSYNHSQQDLHCMLSQYSVSETIRNT